MKKMQLLKLYDGYLQKNPKKAYISNTEFEGSIYKLVDSAYLRNNQLLKGEKLPQYLTLEQLDELDGKYNNKLKWDMLESDVTEEQLVMFEQENDLTLPKQFREFTLGYSFLDDFIRNVWLLIFAVREFTIKKREILCLLQMRNGNRMD